MNLETYTYATSKTGLVYLFDSIGAKGTVKKIVRFSEISTNIYNLGFGDLNVKTGKVNTLAPTNNGDTQKVLGTIAIIVNHFLQLNANTSIFFQGNTPGKTRLYQMSISANWKIISQLFYVEGLDDGQWSLFDKKTNYNAFLVTHLN